MKRVQPQICIVLCVDDNLYILEWKKFRVAGRCPQEKLSTPPGGNSLAVPDTLLSVVINDTGTAIRSVDPVIRSKRKFTAPFDVSQCKYMAHVRYREA
jgi:hypothetical protein